MKKNIAITIMLMSFGILLVFGQSKLFNKSQNDFSLVLTGNSHKEKYYLGEAFILKVKIKNITENDIGIHGKTLKSGYLNAYIKKDGEVFKTHKGPSSGKKQEGGVIAKNTVIEIDETILWNVNPQIGSANPSRYNNDYVLTDYAFSSVGEYQVKLVLKIPRQDKTIEIESEPIKITITEPVGEDLEVWNKMKDNGNFAYFIQEGDMLIPSYKSEERAKFQTEIEQILTDYPNSFYAASLSQSLAKFKASEAKRSELMEKMKAKAKP